MLNATPFGCAGCPGVGLRPPSSNLIATVRTFLDSPPVVTRHALCSALGCGTAATTDGAPAGSAARVVLSGLQSLWRGPVT
jgi:hypothetical protein